MYGSSLDLSQIHAVKQIVKKSLALIQGPPGTGKTYCGALAVRILLQLRSQQQIEEFNKITYPSLYQQPNQISQKPILIICQTNHAIDQFLNHIIQFCSEQNIIRLGCRSKELKFETMSLVYHQKNRKMKFEWSDFHQLKQKAAKGLQKKLIFYNLDLEDFQKYAPQILNLIIEQYCVSENLQFHNPISLETSKIILQAWKNNYYLNNELRNKIISIEKYRGNQLLENKNQIKKDQFNILYSEKQFIQQEKQENKIEIDQQQYFDSDIEQDSQSDDDDDNTQSQTNNQAEKEQNFLDEQWRPKIQLLNTNNIDLYGDQDFFEFTKLIGNEELKLWKMNNEEKFILMSYIFYKKSNYNSDKINSRLSKYEQKLHEIKQLSDSLDVDIIKSKQIVAATLNGCAKHLDILKKIGFETLIIEEAGEVLESQLLAIFYSTLNHLILIGDHQQLQPHLQCYELEQKYHSNISMFERFINNGLEYVTLQYQRRMKSKFADFIRLIYNNYYDHENIQQQNTIKIDCLNDDLIFFDHQQLEKEDDQSKSKSNLFEADMIVQLIQYLLLNNIQEKNITILTTYKRQSQIIKNKMQNKIKVSTVDDYQGDENDIIILSLVRSNKNKKLGYVSIENRICVAFSRARLALIVFGNFSFIQDAVEYKLQKRGRKSESSGLWLKIIELALQKQVLKDYIDLSCPIHQTNTKIKKLNDWGLVKYGGCKEICNQLYPCKHICKKQCHKEAHLQSDCQEIVQRYLSCGHIQSVRCGLQYITCEALVTKTLRCGHQIQIKCCDQDQAQLCKNKCERILFCGHQCQGLCYQNCHEIKCLEQVTVSLSCYHQKEVKCCESYQLDYVICEELCEKKLNCGHKCTGMCGVCLPDLHSPCLQIHEEKLECDHKVLKTLQDCTKCNNECNYVCNCNTQCKLKCDQQCLKCETQCQLQCKHTKCNNKCFEICDRQACNYRCDKLLSCGCQCMGLCGEQCPQVCSIQQHKTIFYKYQAILYQQECKQKCIFKVNELDNIMNKQPKSSLIRCYSCKSIIWSSSRYQKIIKESISNFNIQKNQNFIEQNINEEKLIIQQQQVQILLEYLKQKKLKDSNNFLHNIDLLIKNQLKNVKKDNQFTLRWKQYKSIEYQLKLYKISRNIEQLQQENYHSDRQLYIIVKYYSLNEEFQQKYSKVFWESIQEILTNNSYFYFNQLVPQQ